MNDASALFIRATNKRSETWMREGKNERKRPIDDEREASPYLFHALPTLWLAVAFFSLFSLRLLPSGLETINRLRCRVKLCHQGGRHRRPRATSPVEKRGTRRRENEQHTAHIERSPFIIWKIWPAEGEKEAIETSVARAVSPFAGAPSRAAKDLRAPHKFKRGTVGATRRIWNIEPRKKKQGNHAAVAGVLRRTRRRHIIIIILFPRPYMPLSANLRTPLNTTK